MFGMSIWHWLVVLLVVLIIFGGSKLPEIGSGLGKGISNFRNAMKEAKGIDVTPGQDQNLPSQQDNDQKTTKA